MVNFTQQSLKKTVGPLFASKVAFQKKVFTDKDNALNDLFADFSILTGEKVRSVAHQRNIVTWFPLQSFVSPTETSYTTLLTSGGTLTFDIENELDILVQDLYIEIKVQEVGSATNDTVTFVNSHNWMDYYEIKSSGGAYTLQKVHGIAGLFHDGFLYPSDKISQFTYVKGISNTPTGAVIQEDEIRTFYLNLPLNFIQASGIGLDLGVLQGKLQIKTQWLASISSTVGTGAANVIGARLCLIGKHHTDGLEHVTKNALAPKGTLAPMKYNIVNTVWNLAPSTVTSAANTTYTQELLAFDDSTIAAMFTVLRTSRSNTSSGALTWAYPGNGATFQLLYQNTGVLNSVPFEYMLHHFETCPNMCDGNIHENFYFIDWPVAHPVSLFKNLQITGGRTIKKNFIEITTGVANAQATGRKLTTGASWYIDTIGFFQGELFLYPNGSFKVYGKFG